MSGGARSVTTALPEGMRVRGLDVSDADESDLEGALDVLLADRMTIVLDPDETRDSLRAQLSSPDAVASEHRLIVDAEGEPVGVLLVELEGSAERVFVEIGAVPAHKPELVPVLVQLGVEAAERVADGRPGWEARSAGYVGDELLLSRLRAAGFEFVRRFWRMRIGLDDYPTDLAPPPPGVTLTLVETEADRRLLHAVHEAAFAEHFGHSPRPYEEWIWWVDGPDYRRPDLWWLAWLDGEAVAECIGDDSRAGSGQAYVRTLGVLEQARGRGIGRWLLQRQFAQAASEGRHAALLTVDSENVTGATRLYESAGMWPHHVIDLLGRSLD